MNHVEKFLKVITKLIDKGYSYVQVAELLDKTDVEVWRWVNGKHSPREATAMFLLHKLKEKKK